MKSLILGLAAAASLAAALPAAAQGVGPREYRQEHRIHQGVRSGELTSREAWRLQHREGRLHRVEARDRSMHHGHLSWRERHRLQRMENRDSRAIWRLKHNHRHY